MALLNNTYISNGDAVSKERLEVHVNILLYNLRILKVKITFGLHPNKTINTK